jgi:hypothetical protein
MNHPIDGQALLLAAAKASVAGDRLPALVERAQVELEPRLEEYRRRYECVHEGDGGDAWYFFVPDDHWETVGERLGVERRESDALRRAHEAQLGRLGDRLDRREEFETALELRSAVVVDESTA